LSEAVAQSKEPYHDGTVQQRSRIHPGGALRVLRKPGDYPATAEEAHERAGILRLRLSIRKRIERLRSG